MKQLTAWQWRSEFPIEYLLLFKGSAFKVSDIEELELRFTWAHARFVSSQVYLLHPITFLESRRVPGSLGALPFPSWNPYYSLFGIPIQTAIP